MAVIPNYYFQNPSIEAASRNLASALMPPDPEKTLAAQRAKWQFAREQELAAIQNEMYAKHIAGREGLAHIVTGQNAPVAHSPGEAAFIGSQPGGGAPGYSPDDVQAVLASDIGLGDLMTALGPNSPEYAAKLGITNAAGDIRGDALSRTLASREAISDRTQQGLSDRLDKTDARITSQADAQRNFLGQQWELNRQSRERQSKDRKSIGASGNRKPINVGPAQREVLRKSVIRWHRSQGVEPPVATIDALTNRALEYYKEGYNNAPELAVADFYGSDPKVTPAQDPWGPGDEDDFPAKIPFRDDQNLADILTILPQLGLPPEPEAAPEVNPYLPQGATGSAPAPQAAPVPTQPAPEKLTQLKEGQVQIFADGEAWGMVGGKPVFISPEQLRILQGAQQ